MDYVRSLGPLVLAHRFRRLMESLLQAGDAVYAAHGLPFRARWTSTLHLLDREGTLPVTEIAARLRLTHPAIIGIAEEMRAAGLLEFVRDDGDGRRRLVALTPGARRLLPRFRRIWQALATAQQRRFRRAGCDIVAVLDAVDDGLAETDLASEVLGAAAPPRNARAGRRAAAVS